MRASLRRARPAAAPALATLATLLPAWARAADGANLGTSAAAFFLSLAVALVGLVVLASGLANLAGGTAPKKSGVIGVLSKFGNRAEESGESGIRRALTSILVGVALLSVPDALGVGVISQANILYAEAAAESGTVQPSAVTIKERPATYSESSGAGSKATRWFGLPRWALSFIGLVIVTTILARMSATSDNAPGRLIAPSPAHVGPEHADMSSFDGRDGEGSVATSPSEAVRKQGLLERIIEKLERIRMKMVKLMNGLKAQAKILEEKTEGLRGRLRPVTDFAAARLGEAVKIVADRDDGGSGLPRARSGGDREGSLAAAHAHMFAERIGNAQQLHGNDLEGLLARAFNSTPARIKSDLFRLGATGAPQRWMKIASSGPGRGWVLAEQGQDLNVLRFDAVVAFDQVDWYATLNVDARPVASTFVIVPADEQAVRLIRVRDPVAEDFITALGEPPEELNGAVWTFVDLPDQVARRTFAESRRETHWTVSPDAPGDDTMVVQLSRGGMTVLSGQDDLSAYLTNEDKRPLRLLVAVMPGGALANLGATIEDVTPFELTPAH